MALEAWDVLLEAWSGSKCLVGYMKTAALCYKVGEWVGTNLDNARYPKCNKKHTHFNAGKPSPLFGINFFLIPNMVPNLVRWIA